MESPRRHRRAGWVWHNTNGRSGAAQTCGTSQACKHRLLSVWKSIKQLTELARRNDTSLYESHTQASRDQFRHKCGRVSRPGADVAAVPARMWASRSSQSPPLPSPRRPLPLRISAYHIAGDSHSQLPRARGDVQKLAMLLELAALSEKAAQVRAHATRNSHDATCNRRPATGDMLHATKDSHATRHHAAGNMQQTAGDTRHAAGSM